VPSNLVASPKGARQVRIWSFRRAALGTCAAAILAGCGGSQPPIGVQGAMPQGPVTLAHHARTGLEATASKRRGIVPQYATRNALLFVTNFTNNDVTVYRARAKDPAPIAILSGDLDAPFGACVDGQGTLYVTNDPPSGNGWIAEYPLGQTAPSKMISDGIETPGFCAIDSENNLWVANIGGPNVTEYLYGTKKPHAVITRGMVFPIGIAIDRSGNMYVANRPVSGLANVVVYAPGSKAPARTITDGIKYPVGIGVDSIGTLYVTNATINNIEEYLQGRDHPYRAITRALNFPVALVLNRKGWLYVANVGSNNIVEFPPNAIVPSRRAISKDLKAPNGVAYFPSSLP
jgi:hypothetical protein